MMLALSWRGVAGGDAALPQSLPEADNAPVFDVPSAVGAVTYTPGRGLRVGETGLSIGGYSSLNIERDEGDVGRLKLEDLSFFVIWNPLPRFHLFSELEVEDLVSVDENGHGGTADAEFVAERLYGDVWFSDELGLRAGKFLTPVGRWNVIHAQPLVWTTSRPLATFVPFERTTTGAMVSGSLPVTSLETSYSLFGQFVNSLDPLSSEVHPSDRTAGVRVECGAGERWSVGSTFLSASHLGDWDHLGGLDAYWQHWRLELMSEAVIAGNTGPAAMQWGLYVQPVWELGSGWFLVGRYEHFDQRAPQPEVNLFVAGAAYRVLSYAIIKAEYLFADHPAAESPPGFRTSFALLF